MKLGLVGVFATVLVAGCTGETRGMAGAPSSPVAVEGDTCAGLVDRYLDVHGTALVGAVTAAETGSRTTRRPETGPEATAPADREIQAGLDRLGCGEEVARLVCERMPALYADAGMTWTEEMTLRCGQ